MLKNDLDAKATSALLNGVSQMLFFGNQEITQALLVEQVFYASALSTQGKQDHVAEVEAFLSSIAYENPGVGALEAKLKQTELAEEQIQVYLRFWRGNQSKVHESVRDRTVWNNRLQKLNWRVDIKSKSKHISDLHEPTAFVEMTLKDTDSEKTKAVRFEMDKVQISLLRQHIDTIQSVLTSRSGLN